MKTSMTRPGAGEGRRERKQRETRARISGTAIRLFLERGFQAVTVEEIAEAADISKRSFFDYFPAKEDVITAWQDRFGNDLAAAVKARPAEEQLATALERGMTECIAASASAESFAIDRLVRDTPALAARNQLKYTRLEQTLADALSERVHTEEDRFRAKLLAMIAIGSLRLGSEFLRQQGFTDVETLRRHVAEIFSRVWREVATLAPG